MAVSKFYEIEDEYRAIILDGKIRLIYRKKRPQITGDGVHSIAGLCMLYADHGQLPSEFGVADFSRIPAKGEKVILNWKHNLGLGAHADLLSDGPVRKELSDIVSRVYKEIGVRFASIDIVGTNEGFKVLEINSGVMMENFAGQSSQNYLTAKKIYRDAILKMMGAER